MELLYEERLLMIWQYQVDMVVSDPKMIKMCDKKRFSQLVRKIHKMKRLLVFTYQHQINLLVDKCDVWSAFELYEFQIYNYRIRKLKKYFS